MGNCAGGNTKDITRKQDTLKTQSVSPRRKETRNTAMEQKDALKKNIGGKEQIRDTTTKGVLQIEPKSELKFRVFFKLTLELRKGFLLNADRVLECLMMLEQNLSEETWSRTAENLIELYFDAFLSNKSPFSEIVSVYMTLKNTSSSESVCFKVRTTVPTKYCVRPNRGIIHSQESVSVDVMLQPCVYDPSKKSKDKFRIESFVVSRKKAESSNIDTLWKNISEEQVKKVTLRCVFEEPATATQIRNDTLKDLVNERKYLEESSNQLFDNHSCGPCKTEEKTEKATHFCENCNAFICESCKNCHRKFDVLRLHSFVPVQETPQVKLLNEKTLYLSKCNHCCRENNFVEKYCESHEEILCMVCADLKHKECVCSSVSNKDWLFNQAHIDEILLKVEYLKEEIQKLQYDRYFSYVSEKDRINKEIETYRKEINEWEELLESKILKELAGLTDDNNAVSSLLENMLKVTDADVDMLKTFKSKGNIERVFILTSKISRNLKDYESILRDLKAGTFPHLVFERNEKLACLIRDINDIGTLRLSSSSSFY